MTSTRAKGKFIRAQLERLRPTLEGVVGNRNAIARSLTLIAPPLYPATQYHDIDLTHLMLPASQGSDAAVDEMFSRLVYAQIAPTLLDGPPDWGKVGSALNRFAAGRLERYILWASHRQGNRLVVAPNTLLVEGNLNFGVKDGRVECLYGEHLPNRNLTLGPLDEPVCITTRDQAFILLYGRAAVQDRPFLAAARIGYPYGFEPLATWLFGTTSHDIRDKVSEIMVSSSNPLHHLYVLLVPQVMPRRAFCRMFGGPDRWTKDAPQYIRERAYLKLAAAGIV